MKILVYGDSISWGYVPSLDGYSSNAVWENFKENQMWWFPLKKFGDLCVNAKVGRCVNADNPNIKESNALKTIRKDVKDKFDVAFIMLGTNDMRSTFNKSAENIVRDLNLLISNMKYCAKNFVIIAPPKIIENTPITKKYYKGAGDKSKNLNNLLYKYAKQMKFGFISAFGCEVGCDGEHLTEKGQAQLAKMVNDYASLYFGDKIMKDECLDKN